MTKVYNFPIKFNTVQINFRSNPVNYIDMTKTYPIEDGYVTNPLYKNFGDKAEIEAIAKTNPRIRELSEAYGIDLKVNEKELEKLKNEHLQNTRILAAKIYSALPEDLKKRADISQIQTAALYHDYGKVLIPENILNKKGALDKREKEIMELHSEFGYELLKNKNIDRRTLELIKYHHQNPDGNGYPANNANYEYGIDSQILNAADKYSALIERRSYKPAFSKIEALAALADDVKAGTISQEVYNAMAKVV